MSVLPPFRAREAAEAELATSGWRALQLAIDGTLEARLRQASARYRYFTNLELLVQRCQKRALTLAEREIVAANRTFWNERRWEIMAQREWLAKEGATISTQESIVADTHETCRGQLYQHQQNQQLNYSADSTQLCLFKIADLKLRLTETDKAWSTYVNARVIEMAKRDADWARADAQHRLRWYSWLNEQLPGLNLPEWVGDIDQALQILGPYRAINCPVTASPPSPTALPTVGGRQTRPCNHRPPFYPHPPRATHNYPCHFT